MNNTTRFDGKGEIFRADNSQSYDRQGYINRVLSSSYSLRESDERYAEYSKEINIIFDTFAVNGTLTVPIYKVSCGNKSVSLNPTHC